MRGMVASCWQHGGMVAVWRRSSHGMNECVCGRPDGGGGVFMSIYGEGTLTNTVMKLSNMAASDNMAYGT